MCINKDEINNYKELNKYVSRNSVVVLGSTFMHNIPVAELSQSFNIRSAIYNRSLTDLLVSEAGPVVEDIMNTMNPKKILLQLGEIETSKDDADVNTLIGQYEAIISSIRDHNKSCKIIVTTVPNYDDNITKEFYNRKLEEMSKNTKCQFVDITTGSKPSESQHISAFMKLEYFLSDDIASLLGLSL